MKKKKVLIFYTSKGLGHKIMAENIGYHLGQDDYDVRLADLLEVQSGWLVDYFSIFHTFINVRLPWLWRWFYTNETFTNITLGWRIKIAAKNSDRARSLINEFGPDIVLVTQGSFAGVVAYLKQIGAYEKLLGIAFSDFHLHRYWLYDEADFYLANLPEQKMEMISLGIPAEKIFVCGITLKPFVTIDIMEVRHKLGLFGQEQIVLLSAGSMGLGLTVENIQNLSEALNRQARVRKIKIVLVVICGRNEKFLRKLKEANLLNVKTFGYYTPMSELYQAAQVFLTKPGGLSTAEALAYYLPMLYTHFLPGQEELNLAYLLRKQLAMGYVPLALSEAVAHRVVEEITTGQFRRSLMKNPLISQLVPTDGTQVKAVFDSREFKQ